MNWWKLREELGLPCSVQTLRRRMHQRGCYRCIACQNPYLTMAQVKAHFLWAIAYIFWTVEWLKVLWSDEVTFLVGEPPPSKELLGILTRDVLRRSVIPVFNINFTEVI
jgi:hypothetical protein